MRTEPLTELTGGARAIALTFDDGPHPVFTPRVLAALATHQVTATFFLLGQQATRHPELVEALLRAEMAVGVHGWDHAELSGVEPGVVADQLGRSVAALRALGADPRVFRPPYGHWDDGLLAVAAELGLQTVLWSIDPLDWQPARTRDVVDRVVAQLAPGRIVVLHDGGEGDRQATVDAIPHLHYFVREAAGYEFVSLTALG